MRLLVCGGRGWTDYRMIHKEMLTLRNVPQLITVVEGGANGADRLAGVAARSIGFNLEEHFADWAGRGRVAGRERNQLMLDLGIDLLWAFKDGFDHSLRRGGTEHMVSIAAAANVPWRLFTHD